MKNKLAWVQASLAPLLAATALLAASPMNVRAAAFTAGNIVVYRAGSGTGSLLNTGNPVFLDEYTPAGVLVQSVPLPTTSSGSGAAPNALVCSGTATSEGMLTRSSDGRYLILLGYKATPPYASSLPNTASSTVPRVVGRVDSAGNIDTTTTVTDTLTGGSPRSACSVDGTAFWCAGVTTSPSYVTLGASTSVQISTTVVNNRVINIFGGQLYSSDNSGTAVRLGAIGTGLPTTAGQTIVNLPGFPVTGSPYAFYFADLDVGVAGFDTLYVADDAAGMQKWCLVSGSWTLKGTIGTSSSAVRGLTATVSGTTVTLYGTTGASLAAGGGSIYKVTDTAGYNAAPSTTTMPAAIATATANTAFRGVALVPVSLVTTYQVTGGGSFCTGGSATLGLSGSQNGVSYQLKLGGSPVGSPVIGSGSAISFGAQTVAGTYTVTATEPGGVSANMNNSATVVVGSGTTTWASGGSMTVTVTDATGNPGWTQITPCDLTISATNNAGPSGKFTITVTGSPVNFVDGNSYQWPIAISGNAVSGFNSNKLTLVLSGFTAHTGNFSLTLMDKSVVLVYTPAPAPCSSVTTATSQLIGLDPNKQMEMTFTNASGLSSVQSLVMDNCTVSGIAYNIAGGSLGAVGPLSLVARTTLPANTVEVVLLATKVNTANPATVNVIAIDACGRGKSFDPVITTLKVTEGNRVQQRFEGLLAAEHYLRVVNATPGLRSLDVNLNGRNFHLDLADGQDVSADLGGAMLEGLRNVVILTGIGEVGSSALVLITDTPTGNEVPLSERVRLTLTHTAAGLMLAWPETLTGWQLQSSATADGDWSNVTSTPAAADGQLTLAVPTAGSAQFYRLHPATTAGRPAASGNPTEAGTTLPGTTQPQPLTHSYDALLW